MKGDNHAVASCHQSKPHELLKALFFFFLLFFELVRAHFMGPCRTDLTHIHMLSLSLSLY